MWNSRAWDLQRLHIRPEELFATYAESAEKRKVTAPLFNETLIHCKLPQKHRQRGPKKHDLPISIALGNKSKYSKLILQRTAPSDGLPCTLTRTTSNTQQRKLLGEQERALAAAFLMQPGPASLLGRGPHSGLLKGN